MNKQRYIWEGIYSTYHEAENNSIGTGFSSDKWIEAARNKIFEYRKNMDTCHNPSPIGNRFSSLPLLASSILDNIERDIVVLDFGGGIGTQYEYLKSSIPEQNIRYHIVETLETSCTGKKLFHNDSDIFFYSSFPTEKIYPKIAYSNSTLQYIDDWTGSVKKMVEENPDYLLLDDFPGGNFETFFTLQNYYSSKIPHRFFNIAESVSKIESMGYELIYKSRYFGEILGKFSKWPMENFPQCNRLDHSCTLLFKRRYQ